MTIRQTRIQLGDIALNVAQAGEAGPPVLLLHGFPEAWFMWRPVMEALAGRARIVAPDLLGFNLSDKPLDTQRYKVSAITADLVALLQNRFGEEKAIVVAHDWGGAAGWALGINRPERVSGLLVVNSPHPATFLRELSQSPEQVEAAQYMGRWRQDDAPALLRRDDFARLWAMSLGELEAEGKITPEHKAEYLAAWNQPQALEAALNWYKAAPYPIPPPGELNPKLDLPAERFTVKVPTWVLWGLADKALRPGLLNGLEAYVPQLAVKTLPGVGHWVVQQRPEEVIAAVGALIDGRAPF